MNKEYEVNDEVPEYVSLSELSYEVNEVQLKII